MRLLLSLVMIAGPALSAAAQQIDPWAFKDLPYYEQLRAEPKGARVQLIVPGWSKAFPHSVEPGPRFAWQITLGRELPIGGVRSEKIDGRVGAHQWGVGLWIPVSFHMIEDFKDTSEPIVDTDYRFGFMSKAQYGITEDFWLSIRFVPWAHESTHLGDEYVILAQRLPSFERVNVSYEYWEYGVSFEKTFGADESHLVVRTGGLKPWGGDGYYSAELLGATTPTLTTSKANFEPSIGVEWRGLEIGTRNLFVSYDTRDKVVYTYHRAPGADDPRQWSHSLAIGLAVPENTVGTPLREYFLHVYRGVNPYGQLRSQKDFWSIGAGFRFGI